MMLAASTNTSSAHQHPLQARQRPPCSCKPVRRSGDLRSRSTPSLSNQQSRPAVTAGALSYKRAAEALAAAVPRLASSASAPAPRESGDQPYRPRVVVLGSGWASMSLITALPKTIKEQYDLVLVSPRNYFLYTPLLPAVAAGAMEERSIVEPVRHLMHNKGRYFEATVTAIDPVAKQVTACFPADTQDDNNDSNSNKCFKLPYDTLVVGVGSVNNTFGVPGAAEHCCFLKTLEDAHNLRTHVTQCFERAALPNASPEERSRLLSFVVCGGGPTGVEVAAELHDMIFQDLKNDFPELMSHVRLRVVEMTDSVLATYNRRAGEYTAKLWRRQGIELLLNSRVLAVEPQSVRVADREGRQTDIPHGTCVWSTGIGMHPLLQQIQQAFPGVQTHSSCVLTDEFMRVEGSSDGSILAFGDAATMPNHNTADTARVRALPATAQVAKQQGEFVADLLLHSTFNTDTGTLQLQPQQQPFKYFHKGSLVYTGSDRAIMDVPVVGPIAGRQAGLAWRGYETLAQISPRNALLVLQSFVATRIFGRDTSQI